MNPPPSSITEAAGLLGSGALLTRRVGLRPAGADPEAPIEILAGFKPGGFSLYFGDAPIDHFDRDGRWQRSFRAGTHHLKGLDGQVRVVHRVREGDGMVLRRRTLEPAEVEALDRQIAAAAARLAVEVAGGRQTLLDPPAPARGIGGAELVAFLERIAAWDADRWAGHRAAFLRVYGPRLPFLPPDCPNPVVLRAGPGMTAEAMLDHAQAVGALLGRRLAQCRDAFLVGPGWLDRPSDVVEALLRSIRQVFPIRAGGEKPSGDDEDAPRIALIHGWLDSVPGAIPDLAGWERLRAAGLGRVSVRVDPEPDLAGLGALVPALKAAGIGVGLVLHRAGDADLAALDRIAALPLGPGDLVTLVAVEPSPTPDHPAPPEPAALAAGKARLLAALPKPGPRVVVYNPDKQWT